jgi:hypothetical protein
MITFREIGNHGRLGNQLFQYAFLIGVSKKYGYPIQLPDLNTKVANNQRCLLDVYNLDYTPLDSTITLHRNNEIELKGNGVFDCYNPDNLSNINPNTDFFGLYQSYRYWIDYKDEVQKQFTLKDNSINEYAKKHLDELREIYGKPIIALHLRRGDVVTWYDYNGYKKYLKEVLKQIPNSKNNLYYIFAGGSASTDHSGDKEDITWLKKFYEDIPNIKISQTYNPIIDFALMQQCDQIVLGYISTFAWWAAFLSGKPVFAPKLFNKGEDLRLNYYPESFTLI